MINFWNNYMLKLWKTAIMAVTTSQPYYMTTPIGIQKASYQK